ncbi:MAG: hypothetical protein EOM26_02545 [Alphaproteobacteria bacterium]|nr:hypothetical protein [Alphaproteobacteria bacterium]
MNTLRACALIFFVIVFVSGPAVAQDHYPVGKVVAIQGHAALGEGLKLKPGDSIFMYNTVQTGPGSRLVLLLIDDTEISLGANSQMEINEFVFDPYDSNENRASFGFARGVFQFVSGMISKREEPDVELLTPQGSIGIRGTVVWGGEIDEKYGVYVAQGKVLFQLPETDVFLPTGTGVLVDPRTGAPGATNAWSPSKLEQALAMVRLQDQKALKQRVEQEMAKNIERRHEYRKIMWPYKEIPYMPPGDPGAFPYSDEFLQQKELHQQRMRHHDERMRDAR